MKGGESAPKITRAEEGPLPEPDFDFGLSMA